MKEKNYVPGPARVLYATYLSALAVSIYIGFNNFHPFLSGWRYPWGMGFARNLNLLTIWIVAICAGIYLYYATLGRPRKWVEPLGWFRILLALLAIWYFLLSYAALFPNGWLKGMVDGLGGVYAVNKLYQLFLWLVMLINIIYLYARWAASDRFPRLRAAGSGKEVS